MIDTGLLREEKGIRGLLKGVDRLVEKIGREVKIMEICGTHTMTAYRSGLGNLLRKKGVRLISGPGCPVCITPDAVVVAALRLVSEQPDLILASFGDMLKVPANGVSLLNAIPQKGTVVKTIYSPEEVVKLSAKSPEKQVVFLAVGFETTIPSIAWVAKEAEARNLKNLTFLTCLRLVPPPLKAILSSGEVKLDGMIYPGHVSVIIGSRPYEFVAKDYGVPGAITGFEPADVLLGVISVLRQIASSRAGVDIVYSRAVRPEGNPKARALVESVFESFDGDWRGFGKIPASGLRLKNSELDAARTFGISFASAEGNDACRCGDVVKGLIEPEQCGLFRKVCSPELPMGPCMVSVEGSCLIHFRFGDIEWTR